MKKSYIPMLLISVVAILTLIGSLIYVRYDSRKQVGINYDHQWSKYYVKEQNKKTAYINSQPTAKNPVSISEGQGYGMLICALEGENGNISNHEFEKLNNYYLEHRIASTALMSWKQTIYKNKIKAEADNATDGDLYIAYSLIKASNVWPKEKAKYLKEATAILDDILKYNYNPQLKMLTVGNWANEGSKFYNMMRTSDVVPQQFDAFYKLTGNKKWLEIKRSMLGYLSKLSAQSKTGLIPDFAWVTKSQVKPVAPNTVASKYDGDYYYNACRVPYNLAQSNDKLSRDVLNKMMNFFMKRNKVYGGYYLDGKVIDRHKSETFGAPLLYAAINHPRKYDKLFQQEKFLVMKPLVKTNYYEAALITLVAVQINNDLN